MNIPLSPFLVSKVSLPLNMKHLVGKFIEFGKEIDQHIHDESQWEEKIFSHWFPRLYECLPYKKLQFVDVAFLNLFEAHLANMREAVAAYRGDEGYIIYRMNAYLNEYIIRHRIGIHPVFYSIFEYIVDSHHLSLREYFQGRIDQILEPISN